MDYTLAQALKDAGFYQEGRGARVAPPDKIVARRDDYAYVPTLEELIEACGERFLALHYRDSTGSQWWAEGDRNNARYGEEGFTPTAAVARLWLALNSK